MFELQKLLVTHIIRNSNSKEHFDGSYTTNHSHLHHYAPRDIPQEVHVNAKPLTKKRKTKEG